MLDDDSRQQLVASALDARQRAYAPYSRFQVGAAVLSRSGRLFSGVNVENASYGLTVCAERAAVFEAIAHAERELVAVAVASVGGATPCGACRQVLAEFADELVVLLVDAENVSHVVEYRLTDLLPHRFRPS